jgi:hypothetical protein
MSAASVITIFVRHSAECKYARDEFCRRCRKHFRDTENSKQYRRKAGTCGSRFANYVPAGDGTRLSDTLTLRDIRWHLEIGRWS